MLHQTMVLALRLLMSWDKDNDDEAVQSFIASSDK
jgi:hypothetical protein